jgi:type IV pilus assembly protein PilA
MTRRNECNRDQETGFTLIELMVVLLIIAILLAIAIPTFLGARNTANARSTQESLRNALTAEQTYWTSNQSFGTGLTSIENTLNWTTGTVSTGASGNTVAAVLYKWVAVGTVPGSGSSGSADSVELYGYAKDGNCYYIFQSDNPTTSFTAYARQAQSSGCSSATPPSSPPTAGTSAATSTTLTWSASF